MTPLKYWNNKKDTCGKSLRRQEPTKQNYSPTTRATKCKKEVATLSGDGFFGGNLGLDGRALSLLVPIWPIPS